MVYCFVFQIDSLLHRNGGHDDVVCHCKQVDSCKKAILKFKLDNKTSLKYTVCHSIVKELITKNKICICIDDLNSNIKGELTPTFEFAYS